MVLLKYVSNFWRRFETPVINCEITLDLILSFIVGTNVAAQATRFSIIVPVVTLTTQR